MAPEEFEVTMVPMNAIEPPEWDMRLERSWEEVKELAESINQHGLLQPIIIAETEQGAKYKILAGMRRYMAVRLLGWTRIPARIVRGAEGTKGEVLTIVENLQRKDVDPFEEALAFARLRQKGLTDEEIAQLVNKDRTYIVKRIALLRLDEETLEAVRKSLITPSHALELLRIDDIETRRYFLSICLDQGASVAQLRKWIDEMINEKPRSEPQVTSWQPAQEPRGECYLCHETVPMRDLKALFVCQECLNALWEVAHELTKGR
jgi:ParB family chromosome partitioning protein